MTATVAKYEEARNALATCARVDEAKKIRDQAEALRVSGRNPDVVPAEMKAIARAVAPAEYEKIITQHGAQAETFLRGKEAGLVGFEGDPFKLQREADISKRGADRGEFQAGATGAKAVAGAGRNLAAEIAREVCIMIDAATAAIQNEFLKARTNTS